MFQLIKQSSLPCKGSSSCHW